MLLNLIQSFNDVFIAGESYRFAVFNFLFPFIILFVLISSEIPAQWVNNPEQNTKCVVDAVNPVNISVISDFEGGAFIFWQDNRSSFQTDIYFLHTDANGNASFRADGKSLSTLTGDKGNPIAVKCIPNAAVVVWRELRGAEGGNLFAQKVQSNGKLDWSKTGIALTKLKDNITEFSVDSDEYGFTYIAFVTKDPKLLEDSNIGFQKISSRGRLLMDSSSMWIYKSRNNKTAPSVVSDHNGGAFIFWIENLNNNSVIYGQHIDSTGHPTWGKKTLQLSETSSAAISFSTALVDSNNIYFAYQTLKGGKKIRQQLVTKNGKVLWGRNGKEISKLKSSQTNPQVVTLNREIILSWTNELNGDKDIYIQKYDSKGNTIWESGGLPVLSFKGNQFGQKMISDGHGGAIISWIDRRIENSRANLYGQRINSKGEKVWDAEGLPIASFENSEKSYLSLISDTKGGAVAIFRERRNNDAAIYAQKIFNTGTYVSQILGLKTELEGDSVKIIWFSANVTPDSYYEIERSVFSDEGLTKWNVIGTIYTEKSKAGVFYEFYDTPAVNGTIYYRVVQRDANGNLQPSDVERITYLGNSGQAIVTQNTPNPFSKETLIKFSLPRTSLVSIDFFNSHVEKVHEIKNSEYPAGQNQITFNAEGLKPGIYFYRFKAGDYVEVKKMVITE